VVDVDDQQDRIILRTGLQPRQISLEGGREGGLLRILLPRHLLFTGVICDVGFKGGGALEFVLDKEGGEGLEGGGGGGEDEGLNGAVAGVR
jgi:hypothetical protein